MKLASFRAAGRTTVGAVIADRLVDLGAAGMPTDMTGFLAAGADALEQARGLVASGPETLALDEVELLAPVPRPGKFLGIGLNYRDHALETGREPPEFPTVFNKQVTCVNAPGGAIHLPRVSRQVDYEGELAFVIGRRCRAVSAAEAPEVVAGFTIVNDVSVRDWQRRSPTMILGKGWDTHGPMGPWLVTRDELPDPHGLDLRTWVNDELRQYSNTRHLIFDCWHLVELLSTVFTLEPGDVVTTGTPAGVGVAREPAAFLQAGDRVRIEIEGIGRLENEAVEAPDEKRRG